MLAHHAQIREANNGKVIEHYKSAIESSDEHLLKEVVCSSTSASNPGWSKRQLMPANTASHLLSLVAKDRFLESNTFLTADASTIVPSWL